jgi:hypothetical protein
MAILNNELFKMSFNSHYITKFIISIDEGFLDIDKKAEKERLKQLVSADTMYLQNKGIDVKPFAYYGKLIICSNDADTVMKMEDGEDRWFVIKVPVPKVKDPHLEKKLFEEIPAWLHFLSNREVYHPDKDRFYFEKAHIITDQYRTIVRETKTRNEKIVEDFIVERFLTFGLIEMKYNVSFILDNINKNAKYKIDTHDLKVVLEDRRRLQKQPRHRYQSPNFLDVKNNIIAYTRENSRPYEFLVKDWLDEAQLLEFKKLDKSPVVAANKNTTETEDLPF